MFIFSACEKDEAIQPSESGTELTVKETYEATQLVLLKALEDVEVRQFIKERAEDRMTYDYEVVYGMVKDEKLSDGRSLEDAFLAAESALLSASTLDAPVVSTLPQKTPLLSINVPHGLFEWDANNFIPPVVLDAEANERNGFVAGLNADGSTTTISVNQLPDHAIITLERNERMLYVDNKYRLDPGLIMGIAPSKEDALNKIEELECFIIGDEEICVLYTGGGPGNPPPPGPTASCTRGWNMTTYLTGIRMENVGSFETFGRPELRVRVFGGDDNVWTGSGPTGRLIVDPVFNPDRRDVNGRWWNTNHRLLRWYDDYGSILTFRWEEEDNPLFGGSGETVTFNIDLEYGGESYGVNVTFPRGNGDDYIGTTIVDKDECEREYSVGALQFRLRF
jgi:hypothetical protein